MVVGADAALRLLLVDAPEAFLQAGVDHLPGVCCCHPVSGAGLHGHGPRTNPLPVIEPDGLQTLIVSVPSRMVDVEPGRPLRHPYRRMVGRHGPRPESSVRMETRQNPEIQEKGGLEGLELVLHGWRHGSEPRKSKREEVSGDGLQTLRGGLLPQLETDFMHPRELCIVQVLSETPDLTDEAHCLVPKSSGVLKPDHSLRRNMIGNKRMTITAFFLIK